MILPGNRYSCVALSMAKRSKPHSQPQTEASSSKLPFRATKIRKISLKSIDQTLNPSSLSETLATPLSSQSEIDLALALAHLRASDPLLAALIDSHQPPSFESARSPFQALAKSILYQQLAYKAAKTIHDRFAALCGGESLISPESVSSLSVSELRGVGVSGRKASYLHDLAGKFADGTLTESSVVAMDDESLLSKLTTVKGIGAWSVHMYMIFTLRRPDVLPTGDLGVRKGLQRLYGLEDLPKVLEMERLCEKWKPYRSVGAWYMWRLMDAKSVVAASTAMVKGETQAQEN